MKNSKENNLKPIIIIGAARSGTNILRDTLTQLPSITTWSCDEINYIWRHGNINYPSDEFPVELATPIMIIGFKLFSLLFFMPIIIFL